jgi:hypothetical protein
MNSIYWLYIAYTKKKKQVIFVPIQNLNMLHINITNKTEQFVFYHLHKILMSN